MGWYDPACRAMQEVWTVISKELLDILVCPADKKEIVLEEGFLRCTFCGRRYPIRDGIPVMLIEEGDKHRVPSPGAGEGVAP